MTATFRDLWASDVSAGLALGAQAGWNQTEDDWKALLAAPSVFRAAEDEGRVVGTAGAVVYGDRLAWVCMVLVDEAHRGRGLGSALVDQVLERIPAGLSVGLDATPKGQPVYARLGFEPTEPALARLETSGLMVQEGTLGARPIVGADLDRICARDRDIFGADRARVLHAAFAAAPKYAWCVEAHERLVAYCFGRRGRNADQIGPVAAEGLSAASAVVTAALRQGGTGRFFIDAPAWQVWRQALGGLGFQEQRPFTRMYRGRASPLARTERVFAICGPEFG